jgi:hypothetical protein
MSRSDRLSLYRTLIYDQSGRTCIQYAKTVIVEFDLTNVTLRTGGWMSVTTKRKMNQAARQFSLPYSVYQKKGIWYLSRPGMVDASWDGTEITFTCGRTK